MSLTSLIEEIFAAPTQAEQGHRFELLTVWILENAPEYRDRFSTVWLWKDSPLYDAADMGIDVVANSPMSRAFGRSGRRRSAGR